MKSNSCSLVFTGDIGFDKYFAGQWRDPELIAPEISAFFERADHVIANVEGALYRPESTETHGNYFHAMDPAAATVLQRIRADIWCLANNHAMDAGERGLESTVAIAEQCGCRTVGAGKNEREASAPVILDQAGGIGIVAVGYTPDCPPATATAAGVFPWDDDARIAERIAEIKRTCRWCVLIVHGGEEFAALPAPYTRERYRKYLHWGADAVVGHHPHVPENYETSEDGKVIVYSLGNFIFDTDYQRAHEHTDTGILLRLDFTEQAMTFEAIATAVIRGKEQIVAAKLPAVFADIRERDYRLLAPLAAAFFLEEERKRMIFLEPQRFSHAAEQDWQAYFYSTEPESYVPGAHMDLSLLAPLADRAADGAWRTCPLESVKRYLTRETP